MGPPLAPEHLLERKNLWIIYVLRRLYFNTNYHEFTTNFITN